MLAMLSCIFAESSTEDTVAYAEAHLTQPETPLPMKAPSFSLEYFPTNPEMWNVKVKSQAASVATTPKISHTPILYSGSQGSDDVLWGGDPGSNSFSCGETPPLKSGHEHVAEAEQSQSLSTSPSNRALRRANSAVASAFTASLPRTLTGFISSSPPDAPPVRKRPSPAEMILSNFAPTNITWGASTVFGGAPTREPPGRLCQMTTTGGEDMVSSVMVLNVAVHTENDGSLTTTAG